MVSSWLRRTRRAALNLRVTVMDRRIRRKLMHEILRRHLEEDELKPLTTRYDGRIRTSSSEQLYWSWYIFTLGEDLLTVHLTRAETAVTSEAVTTLSGWLLAWPLPVLVVPVMSERRDFGGAAGCCCPVPLLRCGSWTMDTSTEAVDSPATLAAMQVKVP
ncbi:hypothetical protein EYF80_049509 [Liparis tanakae]|uniref:Uncharacterized protein n=1 Tax=Liparis tanakae TaxID=230148 RepID=A0A4Z2FHT3_9TELE|nr:hypothetical protein EYF80_049509 [Liparis tanakae]